MLVQNIITEINEYGNINSHDLGIKKDDDTLWKYITNPFPVNEIDHRFASYSLFRKPLDTDLTNLYDEPEKRFYNIKRLERYASALIKLRDWKALIDTFTKKDLNNLKKIYDLYYHIKTLDDAEKIQNMNWEKANQYCNLLHHKYNFQFETETRNKAQKDKKELGYIIDNLIPYIREGLLIKTSTLHSTVSEFCAVQEKGNFKSFCEIVEETINNKNKTIPTSNKKKNFLIKLITEKIRN